MGAVGGRTAYHVVILYNINNTHGKIQGRGHDYTRPVDILLIITVPKTLLDI